MPTQTIIENNETFPGASGGEKRMGLKDLLVILFWIVLVVGLGMLAVNQSLEFYYRAHFLRAPCDLCADLNPGVKDCIDFKNTPRESYWTMDGWTDPFKEEKE